MKLITRVLVVAIGIVLIAIAGLIYMDITNTEVKVTETTVEVIDIDKPITFSGPVFEPKAFIPAEETGDFINPNSVLTPTSTGLFTVNGDVFYGTLYTAEGGRWMIVDPYGQVPASGASGSTIPSEVK